MRKAEVLEEVLSEVEKVVIGKRTVVEKVLMAILAKGNILLDDVPGVGKTTLAMAIGKTLGLAYKRLQFTPDVLPSDIVGFSIYDKETASLTYMPGVIHQANLLLGDEINRTSSKTQSALLEAMEEGQVTVDGQTHPLKNPFIVIATQNHVGTAGTQMLPHAQMDRFLIKISIGYPDLKSQMDIIREGGGQNQLKNIEPLMNTEDVLSMQEEVERIFMKESVVEYIAKLTSASRDCEWIELGLGPRGALAVSRMSKACAYLHGRDYVIPEDVQEVFFDVTAHRIRLSRRAKIEQCSIEQALMQVIQKVKVPDMEGME